MHSTFPFLSFKHFKKCLSLYCKRITICLYILLTYSSGYSQNDIITNSSALLFNLNDSLIGYNTKNIISPKDRIELNNDEVLITLNVQRIGSVEMMAYIYGDNAYLPVKDLFDFLKIKNTLSADLDSVHGFVINPAAQFLIDKGENRIVYQNKVYNLRPMDMIRTKTNLYLRANFFGEIFGLECSFNFRGLAITLTTKLELPAIREMQQELMRNNISKLKGERKADTTIRSSFSLFHLGMADWSFIYTRQEKAINNLRASIGLGANIAGGEANLFLNYDNSQAFNMKQQYYNWRYVDNSHSVLRQVTLGKIFAQSTSSIYAPVKGIQLTNTPTTYRQSFGTYTLSNVTEPGWMVELYVNNVLLNYTKADASGFFTFEVPLVYGNSVLKLRFYGPMGEVEIKELNMNIPYNFVPFHKLEYSLTAGIVDDEQKGRFMRANLNFGLSKRITIGGGTEYLSTVTSGKSIPYLNASARIGGNLLVSAEHTYGVRTKGTLNFKLLSGMQFDLNYTRYNKNQTAVRFNYLEEKKVVVTMPYHAKKITAFSRLTLNQFTLAGNPYFKPQKNARYTSGEFLISAMFSNISSNIITSVVINAPAKPLIFSALSISFRIPAGIRFTSRAQYEYNQKNFSSLKGEVEKNVFRNGFANLYCERDLITHINSIGMGLRYNFSFAQTAFSASQGRKTNSITQSARGSLMYESKHKKFQTSNQSNVGKGGIIISPFLDVNCNGKRDAGESKVAGLKLRINGGRLIRNDKDTTLRIIGLEAFTNYFIELDKNSFDNISWQLRKQTINVTIQANEMKVIEVPVGVVGEVSGTVLLKESKGLNGLGRIIVSIFNSDSVFVGRTLTEFDGFFSLMGLAPGIYTARIDEEQLRKLKMASSAFIPFTIKPGKDGDVADGLEFVLEMD